MKEISLDIIDKDGFGIDSAKWTSSGMREQQVILTIDDKVWRFDSDGNIIVPELLNTELTHPADCPDDMRKKAKILLQRVGDKSDKNGRIYPKDILYTNPITGKSEKLFDTLDSVYGIRCSEIITIGDKGCSVSMNVAANSEEEAIAKAMKANEFTKHIRMKDFDRKYLSVYRPVGNYVINDVTYYEGDERL